MRAVSVKIEQLSHCRNSVPENPILLINNPTRDQRCGASDRMQSQKRLDKGRQYRPPHVKATRPTSAPNVTSLVVACETKDHNPPACATRILPHIIYLGYIKVQIFCGFSYSTKRSESPQKNPQKSTKI